MRPKRVFTDEEVQKIEEYASNNCHLDTIAMALGIAKTTLVRRYGTIIEKKRAEGRIKLRQNQVDLSKNNPAMAIFLGKNELNQVDRQEIKQTGDAAALSASEKPLFDEICAEYKLRLARPALKLRDKSIG